MARGGVIFNPDVQSDIDMKNTWKLVNYPSSTSILSVANTIYVDAINGSSGGQRGTTSAFATLAQAMAVAQNGDNIVVRSDLTYSGVINFNKTGLSVDFNGHKITAVSEVDSNKLNISSDGVVVRNLEINGTWVNSAAANSGMCIRVAATNVRLENIYVHDVPEEACYCNGDFSGLSIDNFRGVNCGFGISGNTQGDLTKDIQLSRIKLFNLHGSHGTTGAKGIAFSVGGVGTDQTYGFFLDTFYIEGQTDVTAANGDNVGVEIIVGENDLHVSNGTVVGYMFAYSFGASQKLMCSNINSYAGVAHQYCGVELASGINDVTLSNCIFDGADRDGNVGTPNLSGGDAGIIWSTVGTPAERPGRWTFSNVICRNWLVGAAGNSADNIIVNGGYYSGSVYGFSCAAFSNLLIDGAFLQATGSDVYDAPLQLDSGQGSGTAGLSNNAKISNCFFKATSTCRAEIDVTAYGNNAGDGAHNIGGLVIQNNTRIDTFGLVVGPVAQATFNGGTITILAYNGNTPIANWDNVALAGSQGGTGVANSGKTITLGGNLSTAGAVTLSGAHALTATLTADSTITLPTTGTVESQANKGQISGYASLDGTGKVPAAQLPTLSSGTIAVTSDNLKGDGAGNAVAVTATGTGDTVLATSPTLVTPTIGVATATSVNKWTLTAPSTAATLTAGADNKTYVLPETGGNVGFREIPSNSKSADYTTVLTDNGRCLLHPATDANNRTFTIDSHTNVTWPDGAAIMVENMSANNLSIAITTDTMYLAGSGTTGTRTLAQYGRALLRYTLATNSWMISGVGVS